MSSAEWQAVIDSLVEKKANFEALAGQLSSLIGQFDPIINAYNSVGDFLTNVVLSGKTFDDGKLVEQANSLGGHKAYFGQLLAECNQKIQELNEEINSATAKYYEALAAE